MIFAKKSEDLFLLVPIFGVKKTLFSWKIYSFCFLLDGFPITRKRLYYTVTVAYKIIDIVVNKIYLKVGNGLFRFWVINNNENNDQSTLSGTFDGIIDGGPTLRKYPAPVGNRN